MKTNGLTFNVFSTQTLHEVRIYGTCNFKWTGAKRILSPQIPFIIYITTKSALNLRKYSSYVTNMYESNYMQHQPKRNGCYIRLQFSVVLKNYALGEDIQAPSKEIIQLRTT